MTTAINIFLLAIYAIPAIILMLFGINIYVMLFLFTKSHKRASRDYARICREFAERVDPRDLPHVATQIPIYNEYNVAERIMRAAAAMDYPRDRHTIQVLDDSTDATRDLVDRVARDLQNAGHDIRVIRRPNRQGYKAGALEYGVNRTNAEFFAIFDADFVPPGDFLMKSVPVMLLREDVGLVQARWGHLNDRSSLLTLAQGIGIDGHFTVEQPARAWNQLFMNFNGTAGLWRRKAIEDAGGWSHDTLTEDMDLSYRSQLAGWSPYFVWDLVVPAELPESINAFKSQQFRWAKGSMQTAIKLLPSVFRSDRSFMAKVQSVFHLTHYVIHPIMLWLSIMALPVLIFTQFQYQAMFFLVVFAAILMAAIAPSFLYAVSQCFLYKHGWLRLRYLPFLSTIGIGIAVSNTRAVAEAILGKKSEFVRTPKRGDRVVQAYRIRMPYLPILELLLGIYCFVSLHYYLHFREYLIGPFLFLYACGFTGVGMLSLFHTLAESRRRT